MGDDLGQGTASGAAAIGHDKKRLFIAVFLLFNLGLAEVGTRVLYATRLARFEKMRRRLAGEPLPSFQQCESTPYLLYAPIPNVSIDGRVDHNAMGYRGRAVAMRRTPGVARVLCLGGSTTYGWGVVQPDDAYPAQLEALLKNELPAGVRDVEVINAGLPYGTSAELLTHYHFKFHYFRPDLVIINPGGNDSDAMVRSYYQPDYSHWRQAPCVAQPLPAWSRWTMHSRFASLALILSVYGTLHEGLGPLIRPGDTPPSAAWYPELGPLPPAERRVPREELAYWHNLESLVAEVRADDARVLLVPFRAAPHNTYPALTQRVTAEEEELLKTMAQEQGIELAPFPAEVVSPGNWTDDCHLNAAGEHEKAVHIAPYARRGLGP